MGGDREFDRDRGVRLSSSSSVPSSRVLFFFVGARLSLYSKSCYVGCSVTYAHGRVRKGEMSKGVPGNRESREECELRVRVYVCPSDIVCGNMRNVQCQHECVSESRKHKKRGGR